MRMTLEDYCDQHKFKFIVLKEHYKEIENIEMIHPRKQEIMYNIMKNEELREKVKILIVFGSSKDIRCRIGSDLDLAIELKNFELDDQRFVMSIIRKYTEGFHDVIWLNDLKDGKFKDKIMKGVRMI